MGANPLKDWPDVVGEFETIEKINQGFSISRFGDGEFGILDGKGYTRQKKPVRALTEELRQVITSPNEGCLIGIPTMDRRGDKYQNWKRHIGRYKKWLRDDMTYYSAFISKPACGTKWLETAEFAAAVRSMWLGKKIAIVSESYSKILTDMRRTNKEVLHVECPMYDAYQHIDSFEKSVIGLKPDIAVLSVGVTATALANRLAGHGIQTVDIGSIGGFLQRWPA